MGIAGFNGSNVWASAAIEGFRTTKPIPVSEFDSRLKTAETFALETLAITAWEQRGNNYIITIPCVSDACSSALVWAFAGIAEDIREKNQACGIQTLQKQSAVEITIPRDHMKVAEAFATATLNGHNVDEAIAKATAGAIRTP